MLTSRTEQGAAGMGHAGRQFQALFWKNWLCRLRHPVLSLAEFFWPCILFMILTVLRFQEPPRHRDNCFLQARDLPSRGVLPFVQGLLCNTGSSCRNISFESSMDHHFRSSRFQTATDDSQVSSLAFLKEIQDLAEDIFETMDKAKSLQKLWLKRSETSGSSYGSSFLTVDLNKTEDVLSRLENLHQQPHVWHFLHSLPRLHTTHAHLEDSVDTVTHFLQAGLNSLTSLGALDWLPLQQTVPQVSRHVLNVTISTLRFLLQHGAAANESVYHLSLQNMVWDLQKVQSDLKSLFGLNDLQMERLLNYSAELKEIPTHSFLERMICSILSNTSEDEAESKGYQEDCHPKWSAVKNYIIHSVSWLKLYGQVFDQWQRGGLLQNLLTGASHGLAALRDQFDEGSEARKVLEVSHTALLILSDSWAADGPRGSHLHPQIFEHLGKLQRTVSDLSPCPALKRLPLLDPVLRNVVAQDLRFVQGVLSYLETSKRDFIPGGPDSWRLEKDMFFWGLKQLLTKDASATCLSGHLSQEAALPTGNSSIWRSLWGVLCRSPSFNETSVLSQLLLAVKDAGRRLQDVIARHTDGPISEPDRHLDWKALGAQLSEVNLTCSQVFKSPGAAASPENGISPGGCEYQLVSTVISHILEEGQMSLQEMLYWKVFSGIIGKTCELARYVNMHGSFQSSLPAFSENSPCQTQNMDWKAIIDNYFIFFNNVVTSPITSTARVLNFTKHLLVEDKKLHTLENGPMNVLLSFVEFLEELFLSDPSGSFMAPEFHDLSSLPELVLNRSVLWRNHLESLQRDPHDGDAQKLLEFDKLVTEKIQSLKDHWMRRESKNILRFIKLILFEIKPELREFWLNGSSQEERAIEISSTLGNFSVPEYEKIFSKSFNFSQLFHSDWPQSPAVDADFIHLSRIIIHGLSELSFLTQEQVLIALDTIYVLQNASELFSTLSEHQKQELGNILTHINVFKDRDAALLLQTYSSFYQYFHKFLNIQKRESLIIYLTQIFRHILDLIKQFNIQNISKALLLLSETTEALGMIPEVSHCQQMLSVLNLLELQAQSLLSREGPAPGVIRASLTGLKQLFVADEGFRVSLLQYVNQFFNDSVGTLLPSECFVLENTAISSVNYSGNKGASLPFPWTQLFSNLTVKGSVISEFTAIHCTLSWIRTWTEIWGTLSQILKLDLNIFTSLRVGIIQLLDELENGGNISQNCQGIVPTYHTARLMLNLFKNVTQENGFHDWEGLLDLRDLWVALDNELAVVQSLNLAQAEGSFVAMETSLRQLKTFPMKTNASREFLSSLLDVFIELSKASDYVAGNADLINNFLSNDLTDPGGKFASGITELRETILFLRNVSQNRGLLSCADIFQSVTELISESNLLPVNASKKPAHILAMLSSIFSSKNASSSLDGCIAWIDVINRLCMMYNSSSLPGHLHSTLGSFKDMENKMNSALKILTWVLNRKIPICPLNESNINCVNIYLKDITEFLNIMVTPGLEKEKVAKFETLLALFNNSSKPVNMIIANLTEDLEFASQFDWKHFRDLVLGSTGMSDGIPDQFQNIWQHSIALGKEMQKLFKGIIHSVLGSSSSSSAERVFSVFSVSPKESDISHLHNSVHRLANYVALNLTHYLQNSSEVVPHEIMKTVDLGVQLTRDVFNSLMPAVHFSIPENSNPAQALKKVASLMHSLKKADTELLVGQLGEISEILMSFFKNLSRTGVDHLGVNMVVGLVDKLVASSHSWSVSHLLRLSRLLPQEVVTAVLDVYYALPHMAGLLQRVTDKNITESLRDIYNFTLLHGITVFNITKEDFADAIKTLLDTVELVSDEPAVISEALMCLPSVWCSNHTTSRLEESPKVEGCNVQGHISPSLYQMATSILDLFHLPRPSDSECINENPGEEITRKVVCAMHDFADWNSILSELLEIFHVKNVLGKTLQGLWHKVLPFMSPSGNQGNDSISELCPSGTIKQGALQIIKNLKHANFTKFKLLEDMLNKLGSLEKILNITQGTETSAQNNVSLNLGRIFKLISALWSLRNSTHHLLSPMTNFLNANHTDRSPDSSGLIKSDEATHSFEDPWFHFGQSTMDPRNNLSLGQLLSDINRKIQGIALQNTTVQLPELLEILDSSPLRMSEITEGFLFLLKHLLHDYENEDYFRLVQRLLNAMASGNSTDVTVLARDLTTYLGYLRNSTGEGDFDVGVLTRMLNQEQLADFSTVQSLLESIVMDLVSTFAERSQESALNFSGIDLHIRDFISVILNHTQSKNGGETAGQAEGFLKQLLQILFSSLLNGMPENKISLLLKDLHRDFMAEMRDKILEILKLDPFLTWLNEDTLMNIVSSFRTMYRLIKNSFSFDNRELSAVLKGSSHTHPREPVVNADTEDHLDFFTVVTQFLSQVNNSVGLSKLNQNLRSVLRLVRESYVEMANIKDILFHSPALTCHSFSPMLQHTVLAKLTELFSVVNSSFALRNRETLESTLRLFGAISQVGAESHVLEPALEISRTLAMLVNSTAELGGLASSVDSVVRLLNLAKKVSRKMATILGELSKSSTEDSWKILDTLYSIVLQSSQGYVKQIMTSEKVAPFIFEKTEALLMPFLDLSFAMMGVTPNMSQDPDVLSMSSSGVLSYLNQSKDFSEIGEEMAENLISTKLSLRDLEHLVVVIKNRTQNISTDAANLWEESLDCLVPISNITEQMHFLKFYELPSTGHPQAQRQERSQEVILSLDRVLTENSTERETFLKMVIDLTLQALSNGLKEDNWDIFNLLLTFAQHPNDLLKTIESVVEASSGIQSDSGDELSQDLFSNLSLIQNATRYQLAKEVLIGLSRIVPSREGLPPNNAQWAHFTRTLFYSDGNRFPKSATGQNVTSAKNGGTKEETMAIPHGYESMSYFQKFLRALFAVIEHWQRVPQAHQSVFEMCQVFRKLEKPSEAVEMLHRVERMALRVLIIFAENPFLTKDILCAMLSCRGAGMRNLILPVMQGVTLVHHHYQEMGKIWFSSDQPDCERLSRSLSSALEGFKSSLQDASSQGCTCRQPLVGTVQQHMHRLIKSLKETWMTKIPVLMFLSNFTVTEDVKVKDLMKNLSRLTEDLRSSFHISDETIQSILEATISHSKLLSSVLTVALSGKCDEESLHLLLTFPNNEKSWFATRELCSLPGTQVFSLLVMMGQNLNLRNFVYKTLIPSEANGLLNSLLDVISSLSSILTRAQHALEQLPEFLHKFKITALLDMPDFQQVSQRHQARSSSLASFQSVMKLLCKDQETFLSNSNMFVHLPRVNELLEDDKEKFNIPHDSTPFCLKLYQEILQSPNGALVWAFLKPILHGKILYTPNSPAINEVIQKANYTFYFVDKIKILSETLLKLSRLFQGSGNGQMFNQLQDALRNKFIRSFVESHLDIDVDKLTEDLQTYGQTLDQMFNHEGAGHFQFLGGILANLSSCVVLDRFQAVETVGALETTAHELMQQNSFLASVIFNSSLGHRHIRSARRKLPPHVTYTIRTNVLYSMRTDLIKYPSWKFHPQNLPADGFKYNYIFVPLQDIIERAIIAVQTGQEAMEPATQAQAAPYPCHTSDLFLNNVGFFFPLIMMLTWMVSVASMVRKLVYEREIQIEEYMRMMGLHPAIHFLSWFLENMATLALSSAALAVILKMSGIFMHSDAFIIFLFLLDFGVSAVMLSYFLSVFFNQANTAALCTSLGYMISFLPYVVLLVLHNQLSFTVQSLLCLLSTTAFGQGVFFITFLEGQEEGIQWSHMYRAPEPGGMTFGWVCWMILFDSILYFLCGWYFSNLVSGTFGLGKPWYFPFTASYWKSVCGLIEKRRCSPSSGLFFFNEDFGSKGSSQQNGPGELEGGNPGVALISVTKEYEGHKVAVQELTLTFHRDQITALLGTNGAGKTTIISMLMGLYPPTSGTIIINGKNLQTDLSKIREELGVCPQQDILLDNLTVREHLMLFAAIKAPWWAKKERQQQVDKTLDEVELTQHQHKPARVLSGGMKRKLSIAIAFMGRSKTVVLDEPSSGVDPCSRRSLWDILLKYRKGRTIIFTTHHLDEAEMLSDHVAVLQQGKLRCYAPPAGLKETYGQGLTLTLTKQPSVLETQEPKDVARVTSLIQVYIPQAFLKDSSGGELTYTIPKDADKSCFKGLCQALDQNLQHLHLTGYGISDTTLEEVFLMLLQDTNKKSHVTPETKLDPQNEIPAGPSPQHGASPVRTPPVWDLSEPMGGFQLLLGQAVALLRKRLLHTLRAWKSTTSDLLLPVLFVALAMGLFMVQPLAITYPPLKLTPGHYGTAETYFFSSGNHGMDLAHVLLRKFGEKDPLCADGQLENSSSWPKDPFSGPEFQKSCGCLKCPNKSAGAPYLTNCLGHTLLNLSGYDVEEYLLVPSAKPRLGGWSFGVQIPNEDKEVKTNASEQRTLAKVWYNQKGFHSLPSYLNHLNNLILWQYLPPDTSDWRQYGITLYSHPYGGALLNEDKILESIRQCGVALCIVLGFSILSASIGSSVVRDRVTGAKRLQHISGLGYRTYWLVNFLYDMLFYLVSVCLCVAIIAAFQLTAFTFRENLVATALLLALFGYAMIPWMYLISRIFPSSDVAFISYISLNFIFGLCTMLMTAMPRLLAIISKAQNLQNIYNVLKWVFTIFPQFCLGQGLIELCYNQIKYDLTHNFGIDSYVSPFEMNFLGWIFVELTLQGTVLLLLRILVHGDLLRWPRVHSAPQDTVKSAKDVDVEKEQTRVLEGKTGGDILVLCNLSKSYRSVFRRKTTAVHDLSLAIPRGECFGLLGVNGAGKSTTFKILTGEIPPSSGYAVVRTPQGDMVDLTSAGKAGILFGYCPQQDALDELLTGWEHLQYYCSLRGIPKQYIPEVAADLVRRLHLESHVDKPVATYSGGTRRKLSTALALVGKPDILLLDEPSSGMDPCSKRCLWQTITQEVRDGCAAVLTSHSMEECEALCTRLAIMVDGSFRCLGPPQHIKTRFGDGYTVKVWLHKGGSQPSAVSDCLKVHFPGIQFKGQHLNLLEYHVQKSWECLADLFKVLENNKSLLNIKHYSISQTTLEQVFLNFATEQL